MAKHTSAGVPAPRVIINIPKIAVKRAILGYSFSCRAKDVHGSSSTCLYVFIHGF